MVNGLWTAVMFRRPVGYPLRGANKRRIEKAEHQLVLCFKKHIRVSVSALVTEGRRAPEPGAEEGVGG